jgi:5'-3' exonuclease
MQNDGGCTFQIIWVTDIYAYVNHLFGKIKSKQVFIAVDRVVPQGKTNQ